MNKEEVTRLINSPILTVTQLALPNRGTSCKKKKKKKKFTMFREIWKLGPLAAARCVRRVPWNESTQFIIKTKFMGGPRWEVDRIDLTMHKSGSVSGYAPPYKGS